MSDASDTLTGEDAMAHSFLSRAATAIVERSTFAKDLVALRDELSHVREHRDTLDEIKRTQEDRIALLEAQLSSALASEAARTEELIAARDTIAARQRDIDLLDTTVADLTTQRDTVNAALGDAQATISLQADVLDRLINMHNAIRNVMGQGDLDPDPREEIAAAVAPSPSGDAPPMVAGDEVIADGLDDPNYRREEVAYASPTPEWDRPQGWDYAANRPKEREDVD